MTTYPTRDYLLRALDEAVERHRKDPTPENADILRWRQEQLSEGFFRTNAEDYIRRTRRSSRG